MTELVPFGSAQYLVLLALLLFARGMDFLSTWVATPTLALEANPIARWLGWEGGLVVNAVLSGCLALWPLPAIAVATTSLLVAARNFQSAWLMRSLGEDEYRAFLRDRFAQGPRGLYWVCLLAQVLLLAAVGAGLLAFSDLRLVPFAVGTGILVFALAILVFSSLAARRLRRERA
ncbi:MAG: hypothetical protein IPM17_06555 [Verrucomicrobia bacterium]|nr:hypothetical protein [Verrucomicrobiota bacterium]